MRRRRVVRRKEATVSEPAKLEGEGVRLGWEGRGEEG